MTRHFLLLCFLSGWLLNLSSQPNWQQIGNTSNGFSEIKTLFKDTLTNILYAGGSFTDCGGITTKHIIRWNGVKWDSLAGGIDRNSISTGNFVKKIIKYKNYIYAFGVFHQAGDLPCRYMARWNGSQWDTLAGGTNGPIIDADVYNDTLYVCGDFTKIGNSTIGNITTNFAAKFDGTTWYPINFPFNDQGPMYYIRAYKNKIYGTGAWYANGFSLLAEYTQQLGWRPSLGIQGDGTKTIEGLERIDTLLYVFGRFTHLSTMNSPDIAAWSGTKLYGFGGGVNPNPNYSYIRSVQKIKSKLYCVGVITNANGLTHPNTLTNFAIASLEGNKWCLYGDDFNNVISDVDEYNDTLFIGGAFTQISGNSTVGVAKWLAGTYTYSCSAFYTGVNENSIFETIKIYPNPTTSSLHIPDEQNELSNSSIEISNNIGQTILQMPFSSSIDVSTLPEGCYFITITTKQNQRLHSKFVKQ